MPDARRDDRRGRRLRPALPRRRRSKKKRGFSGCLAVIVALAVVLGGAYFVGTKGFHYLKDHLSLGRGLPRARARPGAVRGQAGDTVTEIGRELKAQGGRGLGRGVHGRLARQDRHPGRLLPAEEEDGGPGRVRRPDQPQAHRHHDRDHPRGAAGRRHGGDPGGQDEVLHRSSSRRRSRTPRRSGSRRTPRATRRATCSRRRTGSARRRSRPTCSRTWSTGGSRPPTRTASWPGPQAQGKTPAEMMTIASLIQAEGRGSPTCRRSRGSSTTGSTDRATRAAPTACSRSTRPSTTRSTARASSR